jgi:uncharacterized membrane protein (DUF4010 family)
MQFEQFVQFLPAEGIKIVLVLFLSFLVGLEREEHKTSDSHYSFGGVRTYPLIGLIGYAVALLADRQLFPEILGFLVVGGFLMLSYWRKVRVYETGDMPGVTSELSGLVIYIVGALVVREYYWIATTITVASILLLELKEALEGLAKRIAPNEILTFAKFMLLTAVILPVLPNQDFGRFSINPFKTWLVVVAVCTISYASYLLMRITRESGILLSAVLGGIYSSTATTVALAKRSVGEGYPHLFAGATLLASAFMYLRLTILVGIFNWELVRLLGGPFLILAAGAAITGFLWSRRKDNFSGNLHRKFEDNNPLELRAAFFFAGIFLLILVLTRLAFSYLGNSGAYILGAVLGVGDVDPFVMSMTQTQNFANEPNVIAGAIAIAAASNNVAKGIYAYVFGDRKTGLESLLLLVLLAFTGLIPLVWL